MIIPFQCKLIICLMLLPVSVYSQKIDFKTQIWPIIQQKCLDCHNDQKKHPEKKKPKSGLQLDTPEMIMKGGGNGAVVVPGKPAESPFYTLAALPADHEDVMPSKGELLTKRQLETVRLWIEQGADFGVKLAKTEPVVKKSSDLNIYDIAGEKVTPPDDAVVQYYFKRNYLIQPVQEGNSLLKLDFLASKSIVAEDFSEIKKIQQQLIYLNLSKTNVKDIDLASISSCRKLIFLHLESTDVTDRGLQYLSKLSSLEYLNLYGTSVSDSGLAQLSNLKNLKKLYVWKTKVTPAGAEKLKKQIPGLTINLGD